MSSCTWPLVSATKPARPPAKKLLPTCARSPAMTTNKPTTYWAPSTALHKLESRHNNAPCILTDTPAEFNDVALIRLSDYEALKAAHEEELFCVRQDRDAHFGEMMRAIRQV